MSLVERCQAVLGNLSESTARRAWREATSGNGEALSQLGDKERLLAMLVLGIARADLRDAIARWFDADVAPGTKAVDWLHCGDHALVVQWALGVDDVQLIANIVTRAFSGAAGGALHAIIRDRIARNRIADAIALHAAIAFYAKDDRAPARAAIGRATNDDAHLLAAIREAEQKPIIEDGGEETLALGGVLWELVGLAADHPAVVKCVERLHAWGKDYARRDARSEGVTIAVEACVTGGWLEHARRLRRVIWSDELAARADAAIAGNVAIGRRDRRHAAPSLDEIAAENYVDHRLAGASRRARDYLAANDAPNAFATVLVGIDYGASSSEVSTPERVAWARALAATDRAAAGKVLRRCPIDELDAAGWELAIELRLQDLVEPALASKVELQLFDDDVPAAQYLARLVTDELEDKLVRAVAVETDSEAKYGDPARKRVVRITGALRELAPRKHVAAWTSALGKNWQHLVAAATRAIADEPVDTILARGPLIPEHAIALAGELASRGRTKDALAIAKAIEPDARQKALVEIARGTTSAKDRESVVAAFLKCPKDGDSQIWRHRLARVHLANGDASSAIEVVLSMKHVPVFGYGPGVLAAEIADHLRAPWSLAETRALLDVIAGPNVIKQNTHAPTLQVVPRAFVYHPELTRAAVAKIEGKFKDTGDQALVRAIAAAGQALAGDRENAATQMRAAIDSFGERAIYTDAADFVACVSLASLDDHDALWLAAWQLLARAEPRKAKKAVDRIALTVDPALLSRALAAGGLASEVIDHARDVLAELVASRADDATLLPLEDARDPATVQRRIQQAARFLARTGQLDDARRMAAAVGLG